MTSGVPSTSEHAQRKLTTLLAADVVGYSKLAGADEERTLARLRTLRSELIDPAISAHRGRVVKRTGDGVLAEFRSVVEAVRCAIEMQKGLVERNAGLPTDRRIVFRTGVHVGDVVEESDGDLMGDGVNIAARLESVAKPGAINLSEDAYRQVKARLNLKVSDLGPTQLKNIAEPVRVYALQVGRAAQAKSTKAAGRAVVFPTLAKAAALMILAGGLAWIFAGKTATSVATAPPSTTTSAIVVSPPEATPAPKVESDASAPPLPPDRPPIEAAPRLIAPSRPPAHNSIVAKPLQAAGQPTAESADESRAEAAICRERNWQNWNQQSDDPQGQHAFLLCQKH